MSKAISSYIETNHAGQECYVVDYDEDQWNRYDKAGQDQCVETWLKRAIPLGADYVVVRLFPDPLFPSGDKTKPYVAWSVPIAKEGFNPVKVAVKLDGYIDADTYGNASEMQRGNLKAQARQALGMIGMAHPGCSYEIWTRLSGAPYTIERGKF